MTHPVCALSTPSGRSAIAVIRATGTGVFNALEHFFHPKAKRGVHALDARTTYYGTLREGGEFIDDVLLIKFNAPHSFTGEDSFELHCHGNPVIVRRILEFLYRHGVRPAEPGEFTRRAYLNGKMDLDAAQAIQEIIDAKSATTLHAARRLQSGVFRTALLQLRSALMNLLADLNAELDFIDEDISFATLDNKLQILRSAIDSATKLIHDAERFNAYKDGVHIALVGKPNAGKSSLMNRLVGEERSIVSEIAGTTRDYIEGELTLAGFNVRLFDTAGLNEESSDPIEKLGIERTHRLIERAHILILLIDGTDNAFPKNIPTVAAGAYTIYAINKIDILPDIPREVDKIYISAKTGEGMPELTAAMEKHIYASTPQDAIPLHEWQQEILRRIVGHLTQAESALKANELAEVVSHLVQNAVTSIAELTGAIESEDILGRIFSRFCIGK